eukprot:129843-Pelagomonas_calceolata.AAC.1
MPAPLLHAIKVMYQDDKYILVDGDKRACAYPTNEVKQGCHSSPLLLSLYIDYMGRDISEGIKGAMTEDGVSGVPTCYMQRTLSQPLINQVKCKLCFSLLTFMCGNVALPPPKRFKHPGMLVDKCMSLRVSEEHAVKPCMAAQQRIKKLVHEHDLRKRPHALLWISEVFGIPDGLYACRVWGTEYLREGSEFKSQLQNRHLCSLRATVKFFNSMLDANTETIRQVLKEDVHLADRGESCWSAHVPAAFNSMRNEEMFKQRMLSASKIPMQDFVGELRHRQQNVWREVQALSPREVSGKAVT